MTARTAAALTAASRTGSAGLIAGLVTVTLWGSAFVGIRAAGDAFSPGALALGRLVVSTAILGAVALVRRAPLPRGATRRPLPRTGCSGSASTASPSMRPSGTSAPAWRR